MVDYSPLFQNQGGGFANSMLAGYYGAMDRAQQEEDRRIRRQRQEEADEMARIRFDRETEQYEAEKAAGARTQQFHAAMSQAETMEDYKALLRQYPEMRDSIEPALQDLSDGQRNYLKTFVGQALAASQVDEQQTWAVLEEAERTMRTDNIPENDATADMIRMVIDGGNIENVKDTLKVISATAGFEEFADLFTPEVPEAASAVGKIFQDYNKGIYGPVGSPEAEAMRDDAIAKANKDSGVDVDVNVNNIPPGQNSDTTNTPRDPDKLAQKLSEKDAATLAEMSSSAQKATEVTSLANQIKEVAPNVGYSGPGGKIVGFGLDVAEAIGFNAPGTPGARSALKSLGAEARLSFTEKTKGAISDSEMAMFKEASQNIDQLPEGNITISNIMAAGGQRTVERQRFYENWASKYGSLQGADAVWNSYMNENPIITTDSDGNIQSNPVVSSDPYLSRLPVTAYTPERIMSLSAEELNSPALPIDTMTLTQIEALKARREQLAGM